MVKTIEETISRKKADSGSNGTEQLDAKTLRRAPFCGGDASFAHRGDDDTRYANDGTLIPIRETTPAASPVNILSGRDTATVGKERNIKIMVKTMEETISRKSADSGSNRTEQLDANTLRGAPFCGGDASCAKCCMSENELPYCSRRDECEDTASYSTQSEESRNSLVISDRQGYVDASVETPESKKITPRTPSDLFVPKKSDAKDKKTVGNSAGQVKSERHSKKKDKKDEENSRPLHSHKGDEDCVLIPDLEEESTDDSEGQTKGNDSPKRTDSADRDVLLVSRVQKKHGELERLTVERTKITPVLRCSSDNSEGQTKGNDSPKRTDCADSDVLLVSRVQRKHGEFERLTAERTKRTPVLRCSSTSKIRSDYVSVSVSPKRKRQMKSKSFCESTGKRPDDTKVKYRLQILSDVDCESDEDEPREKMLGGVGDTGNHFTEDKPLPEPSFAESERDGDKRDETAASEAPNGSSKGIGPFLCSFMNPFAKKPSSGRQNSTGSASTEQNRSNTDDLRVSKAEGIEESACNRNACGSPKTVLERINDEKKDEKELTRVDWSDRLKAGAELTREEALELTIERMKEKMELMDKERHRNLLTISELQMVIEAKESKVEALESYIQNIEEHSEGGTSSNKTKATKASVASRPAEQVSKTRDASASYDDYYGIDEIAPTDWSDRLNAGAELTREEALELTIEKMKEKMELMDEERHRNLLTISELQMVVEAKESKIEALESYIQNIEEHSEGGTSSNKTKATKASVASRPAEQVSKTQDAAASYDGYYSTDEIAPTDWSDRLNAGAELTREEALELTIEKMKKKMELMDEERHRNLLTISELQMLVEARESKIEALESHLQNIEEHSEGGPL